MREPAFWWHRAGLAAALLAPIAAFYGAIAARRMAKVGARATLPLLCVGNFTLGGAGKTPAAMTLARLLQHAGEKPFCLSRGYGGTIPGPKQVDAHADHANEVGDEALLLARVAPTFVARDRVAGAQAAAAAGASLVIMDDGLQNAALIKDFTIAVVDGRRGIGNACVFPAGPLRAPLGAQLARTDVLLVVGEDGGAADVIAAARSRGLPVWHGRLLPAAGAAAALKGRKVLAFAGIGDAQKFFSTAEESGFDVARRRAFPDHHRFTAEEAAALIMDAEHDGLALLTTEKDRARMAGDPLLETLAARAHTLPVTLVLDSAEEILKTVLAKLRR